MLTPSLSLYPGHQAGDGASPGGGQRPWYGNALTLLAVTVLLALLAMLLFLLMRPGAAP